MVQQIMSLEEVGTRRDGRHNGGIKQKYVLDEPGRKLILSEYDGTPNSVTKIQKRLNVPRAIVHRWAGQLGVSRQKEPRWTDEELQYLHAHLYHVSLSTMSEKLGRTKAAIRLKAKRIGVNKCFQEGYTLRGLCLGLGCDHKHVERWIKNGWIRGQRRGTENKERDTWYFSDNAVRTFVFAHPQEVDPRRADWLWLIDVLSSKNSGQGLGALTEERGEAE